MAVQAVKNALKTVTADNNTDKSALLAQLQNAVNAAVGSNDVSLSWDSFTKKAATAGVAGAITSTLKLSCGTESDKIDWNPSIAALPLPGATDNLDSRINMTRLGLVHSVLHKSLSVCSKFHQPVKHNRDLQNIQSHQAYPVADATYTVYINLLHASSGQDVI